MLGKIEGRRRKGRQSMRWLDGITDSMDMGTLESPLHCKEIQLVHPKGDQSWMFIGGTDVEAEAPVLWPPDAKS